MTEDNDSRIEHLYQQSSQETPSAHVDRAVMEMARKATHRRVFSPFGNHWVTGGAMLGVVVLSALLILTMPQQPDSLSTPVQDAIAPSADAVSGARKETVRSDALPTDPPAGAEALQEAPAAPKARFQFHEKLQDMDAVVPEEESRARMQTAPAAEKAASPAGTSLAGTYYLQAGAFHELNRALELRNRLRALGFKCEVQEASIDNAEVYHRVRIGPFTDPETLEKSRQKLGELGVETRILTDRE